MTLRPASQTARVSNARLWRVATSVITNNVILATLIGAILWNLLTWWWGLPSSSSHALMGGFAGAALSHADLAAAAHLSCIDYLGDVPWEVNAQARDWYARIKSRPSFRPLLADQLTGMPPPRAYADLDF